MTFKHMYCISLHWCNVSLFSCEWMFQCFWPLLGSNMLPRWLTAQKNKDLPQSLTTMRAKANKPAHAGRKQLRVCDFVTICNNQRLNFGVQLMPKEPPGLISLSVEIPTVKHGQGGRKRAKTEMEFESAFLRPHL